MPEPYVPESLPLKDLAWSRLLPNIVRANTALAKFDALLESIHNPLMFISPLMTQEAVLSSRIEGTQASLGEILEYEAAPERKIENFSDVEEVLNYRKALEYAEKALAKRPICLNLVREIHEILLRGVRGENKARGEFRGIQNWIGPPGSTLETATFVPPSPEKVIESLHNWEQYCHYDEKDFLVQLAVIHAQFEIIHPFLDGNGRLGRILIPLFLKEKRLLQYPALYVSEYFEKNRSEYYTRLRQVTQQGDWQGWIEYFLLAIEVQATANASRARRIVGLYDELKNTIHQITKTRNSLQIQDFLFAKIMFQTPAFTRASGLSRPHAARVLKHLLQHDIVKIILPAKGRRPAIYGFQKLMEIIEK